MSTCPNCGKADCRKMNRPPYEVKVRNGTMIVIDVYNTIRVCRYLHRKCTRCRCEVSITFRHSHIERCGGCADPWPKQDNDYPEVAN